MGREDRFKFVPGGPALLDRPFLIRMIECRVVMIEDVMLRDSASWMQDYIACDHLIIRGITIHNHVARNNDCIDIDGCKNVRISNVESAPATTTGCVSKGPACRQHGTWWWRTASSRVTATR